MSETENRRAVAVCPVLLLAGDSVAVTVVFAISTSLSLLLARPATDGGEPFCAFSSDRHFSLLFNDQLNRFGNIRMDHLCLAIGACNTGHGFPDAVFNVYSIPDNGFPVS